MSSCLARKDDRRQTARRRHFPLFLCSRAKHYYDWLVMPPFACAWGAASAVNESRLPRSASRAGNGEDAYGGLHGFSCCTQHVQLHAACLIAIKGSFRARQANRSPERGVMRPCRAPHCLLCKAGRRLRKRKWSGWTGPRLYDSTIPDLPMSLRSQGSIRSTLPRIFMDGDLFSACTKVTKYLHKKVILIMHIISTLFIDLRDWHFKRQDIDSTIYCKLYETNYLWHTGLKALPGSKTL